MNEWNGLLILTHIHTYIMMMCCANKTSWILHIVFCQLKIKIWNRNVSIYTACPSQAVQNGEDDYLYISIRKGNIIYAYLFLVRD